MSWQNVIERMLHFAWVICIAACNDEHTVAWFRCTVAANPSWIPISLKTSNSLILGAVLLIQRDSSHPCLSFCIPPFCSTHSPFLRTKLCLKAHEEESLQSTLMSSQDGTEERGFRAALSLHTTPRSLIVTLKCNSLMKTANMIITIIARVFNLRRKDRAENPCYILYSVGF